MPSSNIEKYAKLAALAVALLTMGTSALPTKLPHLSSRQSSSTPQQIQQLSQDAIAKFLATKNAANGTFVALNGWKTIDFVGGSGTSDNTLANNTLFQTSDQVPGKNGSGSTSFSLAFQGWVSDVNKVIGNNSASSADNSTLNDLSNQFVNLCDTVQPGVLNAALTAYQNDPSGSVNASIHDQSFLQWVGGNYPPYSVAVDACDSASNAVQAEKDRVYGDDNLLFHAVEVGIQNMQSTTTSFPGFNMPISTLANGQAASYAPFYSMPNLEPTLTGWQGGSGLDAFTYNSQTSSNSSTGSSSSGGGGVSFIWEDVSGSGSGSGGSSKLLTNYSATSYDIQFGGLVLTDIDIGVWFDDYRTASAIHQPPANDTQLSNPALQPLFQEYFGSKSAPGKAATYNKQALIGYNPTVAITFQDASTASEFHNTAAQAQVCFLFICAGGSGATSSNSTTTNSSSNVLTYSDTTKNGFILGFVQDGFWSSN